jgi:hypothetical protein
MTMNTMHDMAPTDAERAAIQAGLDYWLGIPWEDGDTGRYLTQKAMDDACTNPTVLAGSAALRDWARRTCPTWCNDDHADSRMPVFYITHSRRVGEIEGEHGTIEVSVDLTYNEEDQGEPLVEGPELNVWGQSTVTSAQARALAAILLEAADVLEATANA